MMMPTKSTESRPRSARRLTASPRSDGGALVSSSRNWMSCCRIAGRSGMACAFLDGRAGPSWPACENRLNYRIRPPSGKIKAHSLQRGALLPPDAQQLEHRLVPVLDRLLADHPVGGVVPDLH